MRFTNRTSGDTFDPTSSNWPEQAWVEHEFVDFQIHCSGDEIISENPRLYWDRNVFLEAAFSGNGMKSLLSKAKNIVHNYDECEGAIMFATWTCDEPRLMFQVAYKPDIR